MARRTVSIDTLPDYLTPNDVRAVLPMIGRSLLYKLLETGEIPSRRLGTRYIISRECLRAFLDTPSEVTDAV